MTAAAPPGSGNDAGQAAGIQVTVTDLDSGDTETQVIHDDYVLTCAGDCYLDGVQSYANGARPDSEGTEAVSAPGQAAADWGVYVNEIGIFASGIAKDRWLDFLLRAKSGRLAMLWLSPNGGEYHVMCGTREAAREAHETFLEVGFHKTHVKVARLSACRAKVLSRPLRAQALAGAR